MKAMPSTSKSLEQANFRHLVMDIGWFGLALAASTRFLSVYAIRLGATPLHLGWMSALPSLALLFSTMFSRWWLKHYSDSVHAVWWPSLLFRFSFFLPALTPLFPPHWQPIWLIVSLALPAIPQGVSNIIFVVMMREAVDDSQITALTSRRLLALNIGIGVGALAFGFWLETAPYPMNYQVMFLLAFIFTMVSQWHVTHIRVDAHPITAEPVAKDRVSPWKSPQFRAVIIMAVAMYAAFVFIVPVVPLRLVNDLGATEGFMAIFGIAELSAGAGISTVARRIIGRFGNRTIVAFSMTGTAIAAVIVALSPSLELTLLSAAISGASWTMAGIALFGFFAENTPREDMEPYTKVYHQVIFLAMFIAPMLGSGLANAGMNLIVVIALGAVLRLLAGFLIQPDSARYYRRALKLNESKPH